MTTVVLLATFGLEIVEAGGALALNAARGGRSEAAVLLARPESRPQIERAATILSTGVRFLDGRHGEIEPSVDLKRRIVTVVRELRPEIVITQDPEHSFADLDPDRRPAMILYLEALALAGQEWLVPEIETLVPGAETRSDGEVGLAAHVELERALLLAHGVGHHGRFVLAEPYRREGLFHLDALID